MINDVYVDGTIVLNVEQTIFKYKEITCLCDKESFPQNAVVITPNDGLYYIDDENNSSSFFKSYYATGGFTTVNTGCMLSYHSIDNIYKYASDELGNLIQLIEKSSYSEELNLILYRQIYVGLIAILEAYLSEIMTTWVFSSQDHFDKYIGLQKQARISLHDFLYVKDHIEDEVYKDIQERLYHRLDDVKSLFQKNIGITFPAIEEIKIYIKKRHDLVHRNGKNKEGGLVRVLKEEVLDVLQKEQDFMREIHNRISLLNR